MSLYWNQQCFHKHGSILVSNQSWSMFSLGSRQSSLMLFKFSAVSHYYYYKLFRRDFCSWFRANADAGKLYKWEHDPSECLITIVLPSSKISANLTPQKQVLLSPKSLQRYPAPGSFITFPKTRWMSASLETQLACRPLFCCPISRAHLPFRRNFIWVHPKPPGVVLFHISFKTFRENVMIQSSWTTAPRRTSTLLCRKRLSRHWHSLIKTFPAETLSPNTLKRSQHHPITLARVDRRTYPILSPDFLQYISPNSDAAFWALLNSPNLAGLLLLLLHSSPHHFYLSRIRNVLVDKSDIPLVSVNSNIGLGYHFPT